MAAQNPTTKERPLETVYHDEIEQHRRWLKDFDPWRLERWVRLLRTAPEPAICEAAIRKFLSENGLCVDPAEDRAKGGPDFRCVTNQSSFFVESTCLTKDRVMRGTGFQDTPVCDWYGLLTDDFSNKCGGKTKQCSALDAPCLLAIGTLHLEAGALCLGKTAAEQILTGEPQLRAVVDASKGGFVEALRLTTTLKNSAFVRRSKIDPQTIEHARTPVSGLLLCGFASPIPPVVGVLHPNANRPFDRGLLPQVEFCRLVDGSAMSGTLRTEWV